MNRAEQKLVLELCRFQNPDVERIKYLKKQGIGFHANRPLC